MKLSFIRPFLVIGFSFVVAIVLTILPLPGFVKWWRPEWVPLILIYWCLATPSRVGIGIAWMVGLFLDVLHMTLLGEHALALAFIAYLTTKFQVRIQLFPFWQKQLTILSLILLYLGIIFWIEGLIGQMPEITLYWLSAFVSTLLWPWLYIVMRDYRWRFRVY